MVVIGAQWGNPKSVIPMGEAPPTGRMNRLQQTAVYVLDKDRVVKERITKGEALQERWMPGTCPRPATWLDLNGTLPTPNSRNLIGVQTHNKANAEYGVRWANLLRVAESEYAGIGSYDRNVMKPIPFLGVEPWNCSSAFDSKLDMRREVRAEQRALKPFTRTHQEALRSRESWGHTLQPKALENTDRVVAFGFAFTNYPKIY